MESSTKQSTIFYIPGKNQNWQYYSKTDPSKNSEISELVKTDAAQDDLIPFGIIDGWIVNKSYKDLWTHLGIDEMGNKSILDRLQAKYLKKREEEKINIDVGSSNLFVETKKFESKVLVMK